MRGKARSPVDAEHVPHDLDDAVLLIVADECGDLGKLVGKLAAIARGDAAAHDDRNAAHTPCDLVGELERAFDGFRRSGFEERACVDDGDVGIGDIEGLFESVGGEQGAHAVGVNLVLRAAQSDEEGVHGDPSGSW